MGKNISKCAICGKSARVHLTQIVGQKVHKVDLCDACAQAKGVTEASNNSIAGILGKALSWAGHMAADAQNTPASTSITCSGCGYTLEEMRQNGRLGCPECYKTFAAPLKTILDEVHQHSNHKGKVAHKVANHNELIERLEGLKSALAKAIADERFEEAAQFRDEIKAVEHSMNTQA